MDRASLEDLAAYLDFAWSEIRADVARAGEDILSRPVAGSGWPALRDCLAHILFGYDRWLGILRGRSLAFDARGVRTWADLDAHRVQLTRELRAYLDSNNDEGLQQMRDIIIDGTPLCYTRAELVLHVLLHERGHHGDVTTLLYQLGIEPPLLEYRFHLQRHGEIP